MDLLKLLDKYFNAPDKSIDFSKMLGLNGLNEVVVKRSQVAELTRLIGATDEKLVRCQFAAMLGYVAKAKYLGNDYVEANIKRLVDEIKASTKTTIYNPADEGRDVTFTAHITERY